MVGHHQCFFAKEWQIVKVASSQREIQANGRTVATMSRKNRANLPSNRAFLVPRQRRK